MPGRSYSRLLLLAVLAGCGCRQPPVPDPVILSFDEQVVRRSDFEKHVASLEARGGVPVDPTVRRALIGPFLEERIVVLEALSRGLVGPEASQQDEQAAVQKLLSDAVVSRVEVMDAEIETYFREHTEELRVPETVTVRQILVTTSNEARDVRRRLQKDPKSFEILARTLSRAPEASAGGLMGVFSRGQLPAELEAAAFSLSPGETSDAIETSLGYHVLRVDARSESKDPSLAESQGKIRSQLSRHKADQAVRQFVLGLMARAKVNHEAANPRPRND